ncbi:MAG: hypothetical protein KJ626_00605 [Verrucomicrobia bacterium]|nr:hypothetical protein [Verrucomicrobiota bacterium]
MTSFKINLIRKDVLPADKRHQLFWFVVFYCIVCAIVLVVVVSGVTRRLVKATDDRKEASRIQTTFREMHPGHNDIMVYANGLRNEVQKAAEELADLENIVDRRIYLAHILKDLSAPLSLGVRITDIEVSRDSAEMSFDLVIPERLAGKEINERDLLEKWAAAPELSKRVRNIHSVVSQRQKIEGQAVLVIRFGCELATKDI